MNTAPPAAPVSPGGDTPSPPSVARRLGRYTALSVASGALNVGLTAACHHLAGLSEEASYAIALACVFAVNFAAMRQWVYRDTRHRHDAGAQLLKCALVSAGVRTGEWLAFLVLHSLLGVYYLVAIAAIMVGSFAMKFMVYDRLVFGARKGGD